MFFSRKPQVGLVQDTPRTFASNEVEIREGTLKFGGLEFRLSDVIVASINKDTVPQDGIGGSALFKTREFEPDRGIVQKIYKATFDEAAIEKVSKIAETISAFGGTVKKHHLHDSAFRRAFF